MAARADGKPFIDTINFGSHYCAMYRWDDGDQWTILGDKKRCRMIFPSKEVARSEALQILLARRPIRAEQKRDDPTDPLGFKSWKDEKDAEIVAERNRVFGPMPSRTIHMPGGRSVEVMTKRKVRA